MTGTRATIWHLSRPVMGAALAIVGFIILQAGVLSVGAAPGNPSIQQNMLYYLVAFLIGYREETFRELMKRLLDLILASATSNHSLRSQSSIRPLPPSPARFRS